jgi:hypothetical protein
MMGLSGSKTGPVVFEHPEEYRQPATMSGVRNSSLDASYLNTPMKV